MKKHTASRVRQDLIAARALIADERDWWSGREGSYGRQCAMMAIWSATGAPHNSQRVKDCTAALAPHLRSFVDRLTGIPDGHVIIKHNYKGHARIMAAFDRAIEAAQ